MKAWQIILVMATVVGSFFLGRQTVDKKCQDILRDTVTGVDTVSYALPSAVASKPLGWSEAKSIRLTDDVPSDRLVLYYRCDTLSDTIKIYIPIEQKEYKGKDYHAWVSGYNAALDSIQIFPETHYITVKEKARRWGLGVSAGYGLSNKGLSPYVGVGVYYRIW